MEIFKNKLKVFGQTGRNLPKKSIWLMLPGMILLQRIFSLRITFLIMTGFPPEFNLVKFLQISRIMNFTTLLLLIGFLQVSATAYSQKISINKDNASLEEVLLDIHKQSGYSYSVNVRALEKAKRIRIHVKEASIEEVLRLSFKDQPLIYSIRENIIVIREKKDLGSEELEFIRPIDVKGKVFNEKGEPLIVTLTERGLMKSTSTDNIGEFVLPGVDAIGTLAIIGATIEVFKIKVGGSSDLQTLEPKNKNISMRGLSTINPSVAPLIVLDNFPFERDIENINLDDI
jgi:hypothetical protein